VANKSSAGDKFGSQIKAIRVAVHGGLRNADHSWRRVFLHRGGLGDGFPMFLNRAYLAGWPGFPFFNYGIHNLPPGR